MFKNYFMTKEELKAELDLKCKIIAILVLGQLANRMDGDMKASKKCFKKAMKANKEYEKIYKVFCKRFPGAEKEIEAI